MDRRRFGLGVLGALVGRAAVGQVDVPGGAAERTRATAGGEVLRSGARTVAVYHWLPQGRPGESAALTRGGYLHPVHAPNGAVVTDDFPPDHKHQRGVFFAWTRTRVDGLEPDFWNLGGATGRIRANAFERSAEAFRAVHTWEMRRGEEWAPVLDETWRLALRPPTFADPQEAGAAFVLDLTSRQRPRVQFELPQYRYGGMTVRGAREWHTLPRSYQVLTSEGKDRAGADASVARWVDQSGPIGGLTAGIALLEHPANLGAPNQLRVPPDHPYAVFSAPKSQARVLEAGREYVFRYRLVIHNGLADAASLDAEWQRFAAG